MSASETTEPVITCSWFLLCENPRDDDRAAPRPRRRPDLRPLRGEAPGDRG
jgi:hypothetical protein